MQEYKDDQLKKWDEVDKLVDYLHEFSRTIKNVNNACDAEDNSYDAVILFTGRGDDLLDVGPSKIFIYSHTKK